MSVQIITEIISFPQTDVKHVKKVGVAGEDMEQVVEVKVTVAQLPTTQAIDNMIQSGQVQTSVNGITIQNGLTTSLLSAKAATGNTGFFFNKTEKLFSGFSKTQIPKIFKNSVFARNLSSIAGNL